MEDVGQGFEDFDLAAEFFLEFAMEGGGGGFAGVDLSARELPESGEVFTGWAKCDEELGLGGIPDDGADDGSGGHLIADFGLRARKGAEGGEARRGGILDFGGEWGLDFFGYF